MKKIGVVLFIAVFVFSMAACGQKVPDETLHVGLNAEIIEIDTENSILYVKDADNRDDVFGERCALNCEKVIEGHNIIYADYSTFNDVSEINFSDLQVGDIVIVTLNDGERENAESGSAVAEQIQLSTQRMN